MQLDQAQPGTEIQAKAIESSLKLNGSTSKPGLCPETADLQSCARALLMIALAQKIRPVNIWPDRDQILLNTSAFPTDNVGNMQAGVMYGLLMPHFAPEENELIDKGLRVKSYAALARAINSYAKDDPALLAQLSQAGSPGAHIAL